MGSEFHDIDWQAARWIDRMSRPVQDAEMAAEFDRWILKDPRHVEAYARLSAIWQSEGLHCALKGSGETLVAANEPVASNDDDCRPGHAWRQVFASRRAGLGVAVMALVLAMVLAPRLMVEEAAFATPRGATRIVALSDGSTIRMNGATRIAVRITPWSRHVALEAGEAFFDVAHERLRGFSVDTGGASVSVLGTAFDVDRLDDDTHVVQVYRGLVSVDAGAGRQWRLPAGSGLEVSGERVRSLRGVTGQRPGWTKGWYEANDTPVLQLVQRLNRTSARPVVLSDPALGELLVTGRFQTDRPADVLDAIAAIHDLRWREKGGRYVLSR
ncbi:iron dicitrate transporter FecR [Novosphingobium barchaimii LL02]|uniref:Iron dicitrate transporter FecR n=1 Tax=Novosphingobium barchaimii LL02 TaxID=1114963 RepID=A0A0J7XSG9_9SPHN|nr:FecR domain-containing protein [Novosphingobium barchaimii]KMS54811.1 iron dicitrate transporter FecR [Novosphingobium barchaimii LL02]